jgi:hypothetical protein
MYGPASIWSKELTLIADNHNRWRSSSPSKVSHASIYIPVTPSDKIIILISSRIAAVEHLMTYWSILEKVKGSQLRLTKQDDDIYNSFMEAFPDFDPATPLIEDEMKSKAGKEKWRNWMMQWDKIEDFNFGTMIRTRADAEYDQDTTIFGVRMQFYAVEIAR